MKCTIGTGKNTIEVENIELGDVCTWDAPNFCDAYVSYAEYACSGEELTECDYAVINEDGSLLLDLVHEYFY